eukprot:s634_g9.t1
MAIKARQDETLTTLTPDICACFEVIEAVMRFCPKREFSVLPFYGERFLAASDAAIEEDTGGSGGFHLIFFQSDQSQIRLSFVATNCTELQFQWQPAVTHIAQLELAMVLYALGYWEYVQSKSNWADDISRLGFEDPWWRNHGFTFCASFLPTILFHLPFVAGPDLPRKKKEQLEEAGDLAGANAIPPPGDPPKKKKGFFEAWKCTGNSSYQPIVSQDKDTFIRRYKKTERSLTIVGQDIQRYKDVQSDIQQEDPKVVIDFIETDFQPLKNALDMDELKARIALLDQCRKDDEEMENKIKPIEDKYAKLQEFEVMPSDEELQRKAQMRPQMETFRETLVEAEMRISKSKKQMKAGLEQDLGSFGQSIRDVKTDFGRHAPYKSDNLTPESAFAMLQNYRNQIEAKRKLEAEFRPKQELFGIEPANYKELEWVEQEIEKLTMVWDIRDGWNKEWDKLRSGSFQSLKLVLSCHKNTDDMDELAMQFLGKLRKVIGKDKNVQNWQVYQDLKSDLETFRNMMLGQIIPPNDYVFTLQETFNPKDAGFTLQRVMDLGLQNHADLIARLCDDAKKEAKIENGLEDIARSRPAPIWKGLVEG